MSHSADPHTPEAIADLCAWLDEADDRTAARGRSLFASGKVYHLAIDADGHGVRAQVSDRLTHQVRLTYDADGGWAAACSCPEELDCEHTHAVGLAWVRQFDRSSDRPVLPFSPAAAPASAPAPRKGAFRDQWEPVLAAKLGRPLTAAEGQRLGQLSALFHEARFEFGGLAHAALLRHGFPVSPTALGGADPYGYAFAFRGWWEHQRPPADPWALWQYIAFDWERSGREIPEVFRPLTDTRAVRLAIEERILAAEIERWHRGLGAVDAPPAPPSSANQGTTEFGDARLRLAPDGFHLEVRASAAKPWRTPTQRWISAVAQAGPRDLAHLPPAAAALAATLGAEIRGRHRYDFGVKQPLPDDLLATVLAYPEALPAVWLDDATPWHVTEPPLRFVAVPDPARPDWLNFRLSGPDAPPRSAPRLLTSQPVAHYLVDGVVRRGPPPLPAPDLPVRALGNPALMARLRRLGLELPPLLESRVRRVTLRPRLRCWTTQEGFGDQRQFYAQLFAHSDEPPCAQTWSGEGGWQWTPDGAPATTGTDAILELDHTAANAVGAHFADFKLTWVSWNHAWGRAVTRDFPERFLDWRATLPADLAIEAEGELAGLTGPALRGHLDFSALPAPGEAGRDWFDLTVAIRVEDHTLTPEEIALLLKARGKWVQLPQHGWRRLELTESTASADTRAALARLGLDVEELAETGKPVAHRLHALQLAGEAHALEARDARLAGALRARAAALAAVTPPADPAGLRADLRPYQREGFHFLAHLSANGLGGILADDMGLGKTVQTLAWLLHLAALPRAGAAPTTAPAGGAAPTPGRRSPGRPRKSTPAALAPPAPAQISAAAAPATARPFRALVVCPKSVMHGWLHEAGRFTPALAVHTFAPATAREPHPPGPADAPALLVTNYAQLRLNADWFRQHAWDAVILDEAQFIKNPGSQTAAVARALPARHRLALTGTPVENRLLDLWSLLAFAQPGLLGTQSAFKRQHRDDDPTAPARLQRRARHFLLRRTKAQVATDLPARTEDEIVVELEPAQRRLYDAELKRARAQLLGLETDRALDAVRFNVLSSLLRLRQICCHPALVDEAHADLPSAKLDALLERLEELRDEGHQVLVFSQFTSMLELIRVRLEAAGIGHLVLTGATENRAELVERFQSDKTRAVFLLSLKAAGFGLNLTAASYAILCDPWWNPAVEAQAIDRTHRIGQTRPVTAYRLIAADTVEQKIRTLQREKAALAGAIVQEESLASVLDLESLRQILG